MLARLDRLLAELRHQRARRSAYRALAALDDRTLQDIGIARHDIWSAIDTALGAQPAAAARVQASVASAAREPAADAANDADTTMPRRPLAA